MQVTMSRREVSVRLRALGLLLATAMPMGCSDGGDGQATSTSPPQGQVAVTPSTTSITTLQQQQFVATIDNASSTAVTWKVDGIVGGDANVGTITAFGLYTPVRLQGSHAITAVNAQDASQHASAAVSVVPLGGVLTYHNDNARTGQYALESVLVPGNVNTATFGKLFVAPVDGQVYAQPLYVANVSVAGQLHNLVFVATEHNSIYAFDADRAGAALWHTSFIDPANGITSQPSSDTGCPDINPEIGITSTPVIDPVTGLLYAVAKTKENGIARYRLHALDIATGTDRSGAGVDIQASVPGTSGRVVFNPLIENQRLSLLLSHGVVYFGTGSYCDLGDHHGWLLAYDAATLVQRSAFNATPNGTEGGIWQSGGGAAADVDGNVYVATGNGTFDAASSGTNYGNTILRLNVSLGVSDYFTPYNQQVLSDNDGDLGSAGMVLLPDQPTGPAHLLVGAGKQGVVYVIDRDHMGRFQAASDSQIMQSLPVGACATGACPVFGTPAYFNQKVYVAAVADGLRAFAWAGGQLSLSARSANTFGWPGATPSVSANGTSNGIVWVLETNGSGAPAVLHAYSADDVSDELYSSNQNPGRDTPGPAVKFAVPTIANGRAYVGAQGQLSVFGLLH